MRRGEKKMRKTRDGQTYALPTDLDNIRAMLYANTRVLKDFCTASGSKDVWEGDSAHQMYPCPEGVSNCDYGHCRAGSRERCEELSQLPYDAVTGEDLPGERCESTPCPAGMTCIDTLDALGKSIKKCVLERPYLEWRPTETGGKCIFGNFAHRRWCTFPHQRRDKPEPGVTDVPPFRYDSLTGKCHITPDYCKRMQVDYNGEKGECELSVGQWIGEFLLGQTIFRGIKSAGDVFVENFGGQGVHLYKSKRAVGLDRDELDNAYPFGPSLSSVHAGERRAKKMLLMQSFRDSHESRNTS